MKVRSTGKDSRSIRFPGGRSFNVSPEGTEVPKNLEDQLKQALGYVGGIELVQEYKPAPTLKAEPAKAESAAKEKE